MTDRLRRDVQTCWRIFFALSTAVYITSISQTIDAAPFVRWDPAQGGNGNYYATIARPSTDFTTARTQAIAMGGHLAYIASEAENQFVAQVASAPELWVQLGGDSCCGYGPWLGGSYTRNAWRWSTAGPFTYTNWFPGQPENSPAINAMHYYAEPAGARGATWNDIASSTQLGGYVVELEADYVDANLNPNIRGIAATGQQAAGVADGVQFAGLTFSSIHMNDAGGVTFNATVSGPGVTYSNNHGFWRTTGSQLQLVHQAEGYVASPVVNDGDVAYVDDAVPTANSGVYAQRGQAGVELVANVAELRTASGFPASWPEYNGLIRTLGIDSAGRVAVMTHWDREIGFGIRTYRAVLAENDAGNLVQVARDDRRVPGMPADVFFDMIQDVQMTNAGDLIVDAALRIGGSYKEALLLQRTPGVFEKVAQEGDPAVDMPGFMYSNVGAAAFAEDWFAMGAFAVDSQGANLRSGLWLQRFGEAPHLLVERGDPAPGFADGVKFGFFEHVEVNASGDLALGSKVDFPTHESMGLWLDDGEGLKLVAKDGDPAPGRPAGDILRAVDFQRFELSGDGRVAFLASIVTPFTTLDALWAQNAASELELIASEGQLVDVDPGPRVDLRVIAQLISMDAFNGRGQLAFTASFTDGTRAILASDLVAVPEPATAGLALGLGLLGLRRNRASRGRRLPSAESLQKSLTTKGHYLNLVLPQATLLTAKDYPVNRVNLVQP